MICGVPRTVKKHNAGVFNTTEMCNYIHPPSYCVCQLISVRLFHTGIIITITILRHYVK